MAILVASSVLALVLCAASVHSYPGNSDGATVGLEGQSMSAGHLALNGWSMTVESFWSVDALFYAAGVRVAGLHAWLLHVIPALIATFVILTGAWLAREGRGRRAAVTAVATVVLLLALPSPDLAYYLLQGPWHVATTLWCLLAFVGLSRDRSRWGWLVGVGFLAAGLLGDAITASIGLAPVLAVGLVEMRRRRSLRAGLGPVLAVPVSVGLALMVRAAATAIGTFDLVNRNVPVSLSQIGWNALHVVPLLMALLGTGHLQVGISAGPFALQALHLIGVLAVATGVLAAAVDLARGIARPRPVTVGTSPRADDLLVLAFFADIATFVLLSPTWNPSNVRYLVPAVVFGSILAGRRIGRLVDAWRAPLVQRVVWPVQIAVVVAFGLDVATYVTAPAPVQPVQRLATFLGQHHLAEGIGDYWSSSIVTVQSGGAVTVRPVTNDAQDILLRYDRQSSSSWYGAQNFQFFVYNTARPWRQVNAGSATKTFGVPSRTYDVGTFRVLLWSRPLTLSPALPPQPDPVRIYWRL